MTDEDKEDYEQRLKNILNNLGLTVNKYKDEEKVKSTTRNHGELVEVQEESENLSESHQKKTKNTIKSEQEISDDPKTSPVYLSWKAYKRMVGYALRYANNELEQSTWREVYGVLVGYIEDNKRVIIKDSIPIMVGSEYGFELEPIHYVDVSDINTNIFHQSLDSNSQDFIVGWWHSHPGFGHFFSEVDIMNQIGYQVPNPFAVGLVFDHCEKNEESLGVKALRLMEPNKGMETSYDFVELRYYLEHEKAEIFDKVNKLIIRINENMPKVLEEIERIENVLVQKTLPQLQKKFSLILDEDLEDREEEEPQEYIKKSYIWEHESFKNVKGAPKFRARIEAVIKNCDATLKDLLEKGKNDKYKEKKETFQKRINVLLSKPNKMLQQVMDDFATSLDIIYPFFDFLDSAERKSIEHFEKGIYDYFQVLDNLKFSLANL